MTDLNIVDQINKKSMNSAVGVYASYDQLSPPEQAALARIGGRVKGKRILDIGVGGGRTVPHLLALSDDYIGVDYVQGMVDACRRKFAGVQFECVDARTMTQFADDSFDLVVFAWAGICMVDHAGRLAILGEVRRLLKPGGHFVFSTYNQNSDDHHQSFEFPEFSWTANPVRLARRTLGFWHSSIVGLYNKWRLRSHEVRGTEYSIVNDRCHDYATMLYYISPSNQRQQLAQAGFATVAAMYDTDGLQVGDETRCGAVTFVVEA